jgi:beta-lactam-binding protein with PASTA domain
VAATTEPPTSVKDNVVSINPAEGAEVAQSTQITVTYATGQSPFPNLVGYDVATATQKAKDAGFATVSIVNQVGPTDASQPAGHRDRHRSGRTDTVPTVRSR